MNKLPGRETISEPARKVDIFARAQVVVVGGGPAGVTAAVAAAREGADTLLVERYGHLGGMATGGLVLMINQFPPGQCQEWMERLKPLGGARDLSQTREPGGSRYSFMVDPELLKCILNDMALQAGVRLLLHSWGASAIVEGNKVKGVIFESKSGRQAVLGDVVIDTTGDGDIFASAGADFDSVVENEYRSSQLAMVFRIGNIDYDKFVNFKADNPEKWLKMRDEVDGVAGFHVGPMASSRSDVVWVNNFIKGRSSLKVEDLTWVEINVRKAMLPVYEYFKKRLPGFENSFIYDSASQIGTRGSRRLVGEYVLTKQDIDSRKPFKDTVAVFPKAVPLGVITEKAKAPENVAFPYRCLVPVKMDGLLAAGRNFSSDPAANTMFNVIPHCVAMGQAAGTAAALAVKSKINPRQVEYKALRERLASQGIRLPG
jgi:hypothetical protein